MDLGAFKPIQCPLLAGKDAPPDAPVVQTAASVSGDHPSLAGVELTPTELWAAASPSARAIISTLADESHQGSGGHYELYAERFSCAVREAIEAANPEDRPGLEAAAGAFGDYDPRAGIDYTWKYDPEENDVFLIRFV